MMKNIKFWFTKSQNNIVVADMGGWLSYRLGGGHGGQHGGGQGGRHGGPTPGPRMSVGPSHFFWFPFCQRLWELTKSRDNIVVADMVADLVTDLEVDMVANMGVDKVADMVADIVADMKPMSWSYPMLWC